MEREVRDGEKGRGNDPKREGERVGGRAREGAIETEGAGGI